MNKASQPHPSLNRILQRLSPEAAASFTPSQIEALNLAFSSESVRKHSVDIRLDLPFPGRGFYLVILAGPERRSAKRRPVKHSRHLYTRVLAHLVLISLLAAVSVLAVLRLSTEQAAEPANLAHPTSIPWLLDKQACEATGRTWKDTRCWDDEWSPQF